MQSLPRRRFLKASALATVATVGSFAVVPVVSAQDEEASGTPLPSCPHNNPDHDDEKKKEKKAAKNLAANALHDQSECGPVQSATQCIG